MVDYYFLGRIIREERKRLGITQEELCNDEKDLSLLSRLERDKRIPDRKTVEYFFEKLGLLIPEGSIPMTEAEYRRYCLEYELTVQLADGATETLEKLEAYKSCTPNMGRFERQFYEYHRTLYESIHGAAPEGAAHRFADALRLTLPSFRLDGDIPAEFLSKTELMILNNIARMDYQSGKKTEAIRLMRFLRDYFNSKPVDIRVKAEKYPVILFNLAGWLDMAGNIEEALQLSNEGIEFCARHGKLFYFAYHIFNTGYCLAEQGKLDEAKALFDYAFKTMELTGKHDEVLMGKKELNKLFGYDFPEK